MSISHICRAAAVVCGVRVMRKPDIGAANLAEFVLIYTRYTLLYTRPMCVRLKAHTRALIIY